ncbi:diguanylate cyclase [Neptunomonas sp. XY-337]|uniref:putative bifunctional diguanylate cyclase/phosphodiesterase n=1 Tax=Neptunomonas sp. XY-337 TaxID=2561897 RepID=UPI0010AA9996|nr:diguanylate cyclase [Neptunomonas sp. XY-337]
MRSPLVRLLPLLIVVVVFAVSSVVSLQRNSEASQLIAVSMKNGAWSATELESEMQHFLYALELLPAGLRRWEEVRLRFDLFWSRVGVLTQGEENREFRSRQEVRSILVRLEGLFEKHEAYFDRESPPAPAVLASTYADFSALLPLIREINVQSFNGENTFLRLERIQNLHQEISVFLLGLLCSGAALVFIIARQSARNRRLALHDALTGLPNRNYFNEQLASAEARAFRTRARMAIHVVDVNDFKLVNDEYGHAAGDHLLTEVAKRLSSCVRRSDTVARMGGDEFAIIQEHLDDVEAVAQLGERICKAMQGPITLGSESLHIAVSVGASIYPDDAASAEQTMVNADQAMYQAKLQHAMRFQFFDRSVNDQLVRRQMLAADFPAALSGDELGLRYQPILALKTDHVWGVDAQAYWEHPVFGGLDSLEISTIAEYCGLGRAYSEWQVRTACQACATWFRAGFVTLPVHLEVSSLSYIDSHLATTLKQELERLALPGHCIVIKVSEEVVVRHLEAARRASAVLSRLGVGIALDKFGAGCASIKHLNELPIQLLKVDCSLTHSVQRDTRLLYMIAQLLAGLKLEGVVEGVETESERAVLRRMGFVWGQGGVFCEPVELTALLRFLGKQSTVG